MSLAKADPEEARLVLPALANLIEESRGRLRRLSVREAQWIAKLRAATGEAMSPQAARHLAMAYVVFEDDGRDTAPLDRHVAFAEWSTWPDPSDLQRRAVDEWKIAIYEQEVTELTERYAYIAVGYRPDGTPWPFGAGVIRYPDEKEAPEW